MMVSCSRGSQESQAIGGCQPQFYSSGEWCSNSFLPLSSFSAAPLAATQALLALSLLCPLTAILGSPAANLIAGKSQCQ